MSEPAPIAAAALRPPPEGQYPTCPRRSPLRLLLLAETGQDVRLCVQCANCDGLTLPGMDLSIGEIVRAAARNDLRALTATTLSVCDDLLLRPIPCTAGLDLNAILLFLQREAELRGLSARPEGPTP